MEKTNDFYGLESSIEEFVKNTDLIEKILFPFLNENKSKIIMMTTSPKKSGFYYECLKKWNNS